LAYADTSLNWDYWSIQIKHKLYTGTTFVLLEASDFKPSNAMEFSCGAMRKKATGERSESVATSEAPTATTPR
jgi:hypothetical protein